MTPNLDQERVERAANRAWFEHCDRQGWPNGLPTWDEMDQASPEFARTKREIRHDIRAAITAYQGDTHVVVPLDLVRRVTSIARRNEDAPEIHELSAMLSPTPAGKER